MKILLIGADGQLGFELLRELGPAAIPLTHQDIEIGDAVGTLAAVEAAAPETVINTAAYHNLPDCEKDPERAARSAVQVIVLGLVVAIPLGAVGALLAPRLLGLMGASAAVRGRISCSEP